ncbi:hypothetical protein BDN67DRAFT_974013 [Paxillus ammoniavirescens]|nr:hypothetical protein BDN67DRAFT_974013 [Paxillus ammoniavirescens]
MAALRSWSTVPVAPYLCCVVPMPYITVCARGGPVAIAVVVFTVSSSCSPPRLPFFSSPFAFPLARLILYLLSLTCTCLDVTPCEHAARQWIQLVAFANVAGRRRLASGHVWVCTG